MTVLDLFVAATLAQVTLITAAALIVIWFGRRHSAFRHAAGVVGLLLVVSSPLLVLALPRPAWLLEEKPSNKSISQVAGQSANLQSPGVQANRQIAEQADVASDRVTAGESIAVARQVPEAIEFSR